MHERDGNQRGAALLTALLIAALLAGIAAVIVTVTTTERSIAAAHRHALEAAYAADAAFERALHDLALIASWSDVILPAPANVQSSFVDGQTHPRLPDGRRLDLAALTSARQAASDAHYGPAVHGADAPRWRLFGHAPLQDLVPAGHPAQPAYLVVWVADDGGDGDGEAALDSNGRVLLYAAAYAAGGARRAVEALVGRTPDGAVHVLAYHPVR